MDFYVNIFKNIASKEQGAFYFSDSDLDIGGGLYSPNVVFHLKIPYKHHQISIINKMGTSYVGIYSCVLPLSLKAPDFTINTKSHLSTLFSTDKKDRFKIVTHHRKLQTFLERSTSLKALNTIAKDTAFESYICGRNSTNEYELKIEYHLQFDNWTQVLEPLIAFQKELITLFESKNYTISVHQNQN
ncbi:hypothetical protein [uncultured Dokdonia sp.]|uniref:hypothetical protein n=1 Tax=uncultured Dokdonia sp. TaxID=575653 RepID=UPI0026296FE3|nr:hypothetical protein [uncultured Dokdonia sp.]